MGGPSGGAGQSCCHLNYCELGGVDSGLVVWLVSMDFSSILIWNVWGLNDRGRRDNLRKLVDDLRPCVVCLQETKLSHISEWDVASFLGREFSKFVFLPAQQTRGGHSYCLA